MSGAEGFLGVVRAEGDGEGEGEREGEYGDSDVVT